MRTFAGKFREYPLISADNFEKENLDSLAFFLSHCHKDHMVGLDSTALYHRLKTSKTVFLYCSETTENLLMCNPTYSHLKDYIRSIPVDQQTMVPLVDEKTGQESSFCVTLLPAGHCVGSVMFLFEGPGGNVLYTGDFRLSKGDVKRISFFHTKEGIKDIKSIYIDTTFCLPRMKSLPSRQQSRDAVINLIDRWFSRGPEYAVSLLCKGMYGYEYLLKEIAMNYRTKIHVSAERLAMYRYLPDMTPYFTTNGQSTKIHACKWQANQRCDSDLPCGSSVHPSLKTKVLRIKPTTMWVARSTEPMPEDFKRYDKGKRLWRVVHSMHASMEEIEDLVGYLRPYHVFPNVPPAGLDTLDDAFERLKGLTRIQDCDSCNQDESVEERFKQHAVHLSGEGVTKDKKSLEEKAALRKIQLCAPPKPDERVLAQCKELGLIDDENFTPPLKRRRSRRQDIALEEKTSVPQDTQGSSSRKVIISVSQEIQGNSLGGINTTIQQQSNEKSFGEVTTVSPQTHGESSKDVDRSVSQHANINRYEFITEGKPMICPKVEDVQDRPTEFYENSCCPPKTEKKAEDEKPAECKVSEALSNTVVLERTSHGQKSLDGIASNKIDNNRTSDTGMTSSIPVSVVELSGSDENYDQGPVGGEPRSKADFDIPPSPGHVKPLPDKLSAIHKLLGNGESTSITNILKF